MVSRVPKADQRRRVEVVCWRQTGVCWEPLFLPSCVNSTERDRSRVQLVIPLPLPLLLYSYLNLLHRHTSFNGGSDLSGTIYGRSLR